MDNPLSNEQQQWICNEINRVPDEYKRQIIKSLNELDESIETNDIILFSLLDQTVQRHLYAAVLSFYRNR